jgi:hypothetical protein
MTNESPASRPRSGGPRGAGGPPRGPRRDGGPSRGPRRGAPKGGGIYSGGGTGPRRFDTEPKRSKAYTSETFMYKENLDEKKPAERKMRSRRKRPSSGE